MATSSGGLPISMALITAGGLLVYTAFKGVSIVDAFAGVTSDGVFSPSPDSQDNNDRSAPDRARGGTTLVPGLGDISKSVTGALGGSATVTIDGHPVAGWVARDVLCARQHGWGGTVTDGVRTDSEQKQACIHVCGNPNGCPGTCAAPGSSNHRGTVWPLGAVDVTDPHGFQAALLKCPASRLRGFKLPNDLVHFSATGH